MYCSHIKYPHKLYISHYVNLQENTSLQARGWVFQFVHSNLKISNEILLVRSCYVYGELSHECRHCNYMWDTDVKFSIFNKT